MSIYLLDNYSLTGWEALQSLFVSEYGLRHLAQAEKEGRCKWGHRAIAVVELCPVIGLIATIIEAIVTRILLACPQDATSNLSPPHPESCPKPLRPAPKATLITSPPATSPQPLGHKKWLFKGSQLRCNGSVSISEAKTIVRKLNDQSRPEIKFNKAKVTDQVFDGTCTAMSLEFLDSYFKIKELCKGQPDYKPQTLLNRIAQLSPKFSLSSKVMRNRQAAYNTIEVKNPAGDPSLNKIQSLANYHCLKIDHSSNEFNVGKMSNEKEVTQEIDNLPEGAYFVRILKTANNEKLEEYGHSLVYIKEEGIDLFYDPNYGLISFFEQKSSNYIYNQFKKCYSMFQTEEARFYRLHP